MNLVKKDPSSTRVAELSTRQGRYDKRCHIFRNGEFFDGFISSLQPGDSFYTYDAPKRWLSITGKVRSWDTKNEPGHPSFAFDGLHVLQAAPTADKQPALLNPEPKKEAPKLLDDIEDVDFKDV